MTIEAITSAALALPPESREELALALLKSLDEAVAAKYWDEWQLEIEDRLSAFDRGEIPAVSREEAMRLLDQDAAS